MPNSVWDAATDRELLLSIVDTQTLSKIEWGKVSTMLKAKGFTFSHEACRQHYQKILKGGRNGQAGTPNKPKEKRAKSTPGSQSKAKTSKNIKANDDNDDDDEGSLNDETPTKKRKLEVKEEGEDLGGSVGQNAAQLEPKIEEEDFIESDNDDIYLA
ncbi:MAG: hypothetical protein M1818_002384 [Claussenomyces sp. TS43310]|nr:MAG: hypothetical protein M1818_002384 [Claussenomyces sp. TS43310]